jgi:hypothetical protein
LSTTRLISPTECSANAFMHQQYVFVLPDCYTFIVKAAKCGNCLIMLLAEVDFHTKILFSTIDSDC